jgi:multidrug efflux system membrane fusion protein
MKLQSARYRTDSARTALGLCLVASLLAAGCASKGSTPEKKGGRPDGVPVTVTTVSRRDVPVEVQVIGNVEAYSTITVRAQVGGELTRVAFREGDFVRKGDLLFTIDPRPLQASVQQMEANLARDTAQLSQAQAALARDIAQEKYARSQSGRYDKLMQEGIISKEQAEQLRTGADALSSSVEADRAAIESARAAIAATKAALENARVQLGYTEIRSPIEGRTGATLVKQGNLVSANTMDLTTINQVQPIYVTFAVPEAQLSQIKRYMGSGKLPVIAFSQEDPNDKHTGVLTFVDNTVDTSTGTIRLKATFPNTDRKLWPGQFVRVVLRLTTQSNAVVVPNQAVQTGQEGSFVYVVKPDRTVESRPVVPGARVEGDLVIDRGLRPGETVVTEGQLRLAPGSRVIIRDGRGVPGGGRGRTRS